MEHPLNLSESKTPGVIGVITGVYSVLDTPSSNGRLYTREFWTDLLKRKDVIEDLREGRIIGTFIHPSIQTLETTTGAFSTRHPIYSGIVTKELWIEGNKVLGRSYILDTDIGKLIKTYMSSKDDKGNPLFSLYMSVRGGSLYDYIDNRTGLDVLRASDYYLSGFDIVPIPGVKGTRIKLESYINNKVFKLTDKFNRTRAQTENNIASIKRELGLISI